MVFRKPYAFLIKHFKLLHVILTGVVIYLIIRMTGTISFINDYLNANVKLISLEQFESAYNALDFVFPVIVLLFSVILFFVMTLKKKPNKFYMYAMLIALVTLILNVYGYYTLRSLTEVWLKANRLSMLSDFYVFALVANVVLCAMSASRAIGFNIGRFDFNNDISQFDLSEEDSAEFEVSVDFDIDVIKRNAKKRIRYLNYFYKENKRTIFGTLLMIIFVSAIYGLSLYFRYRKDVIRGNILSYNGFSVQVNNAYVINSDSEGNQLKDNKHIVVVDTSITNLSGKDSYSFPTGTLSLNVGAMSYTLTKQYNAYISDLGKMYNDEKIKAGNTVKSIFAFEVPESNLNSTILLGVRDLNGQKTHYLKLNTTNLSNEDDTIKEEFLGEELVFDNSLFKDTRIKIDSFEINDKYKINYRFCANSTTCLNSVEYLVPRNNTSNYDMTILKINGSFDINNNALFTNFYQLFETFGYIEYKIAGKTYQQTSGFKQISSKKINNNNTYYIGVLKDIKNAESVCLGLKIRNIYYRYYLTKEVS